MDNFSVIASLVLCGLFLIARPAEGFVVGYIDLADQRLQSSLHKRQNKPTVNYLDNMNSPGDQIDIFSSPDNPQDPMVQMNFKYPDKEVETNMLSEKQNGGTSQSEDEKRDGEKTYQTTNEKKATHTTNTLPQIENDNQLADKDTVTLVVIQLPPSRTQQPKTNIGFF